jgi:hypothetical protein
MKTEAEIKNMIDFLQGDMNTIKKRFEDNKFSDIAEVVDYLLDRVNTLEANINALKWAIGAEEIVQ